MTDSPFPAHIPKIGELLRVSPVKIDYVVNHYQDFCEEAHVVSRFFAKDYEGKTIIEVSLGGRLLVEPLRFSLESSMCLTVFDGHDRIVQMESILE